MRPRRGRETGCPPVALGLSGGGRSPGPGAAWRAGRARATRAAAPPQSGASTRPNPPWWTAGCSPTPAAAPLGPPPAAPSLALQGTQGTHHNVTTSILLPFRCTSHCRAEQVWTSASPLSVARLAVADSRTCVVAGCRHLGMGWGAALHSTTPDSRAARTEGRTRPPHRAPNS